MGSFCFNSISTNSVWSIYRNGYGNSEQVLCEIIQGEGKQKHIVQIPSPLSNDNKYYFKAVLFLIICQLRVQEFLDICSI